MYYNVLCYNNLIPYKVKDMISMQYIMRYNGLLLYLLLIYMYI